MVIRLLTMTTLVTLDVILIISVVWSFRVPKVSNQDVARAIVAGGDTDDRAAKAILTRKLQSSINTWAAATPRRRSVLPLCAVVVGTVEEHLVPFSCEFLAQLTRRGVQLNGTSFSDVVNVKEKGES